MSLIVVPLLAGIVGLLFVVVLALEILRKNPGNELMVRISRSVQEGARATERDTSPNAPAARGESPRAAFFFPPGERP